MVEFVVVVVVVDAVGLNAVDTNGVENDVNFVTLGGTS